MFEGFIEEMVPAGSIDLFVRHGGDGPPVLLLHGHPRTSSTWYRVAPRLVAAGYRVVCVDLPGYGRSGKPTPAADHASHSKRAMAAHLVTAMQALGHPRFALVGHDRGSYAGLRLALDHPDQVTKAVLIDCLPISEHLRRITPEFATAWFHWFFFAQPEVPERVINADPEAWYGGSPEAMGIENFAERQAAIRDPQVVRGMVEDYRAGLTIDRRDEEADRSAGRTVRMPLLVLWSTLDDLEELYGDPLPIWRQWAQDVQGQGIQSRHHVAEEAPDALTDALVGFLRDRAD